MQKMFLVGKRDPTRKLWLVERGGMVDFGEFIESLYSGAVVKIFLSPECALEYVKKFASSELQNCVLCEVKETEDGAAFVEVPWPT
jgi:hypothetical protein